MSSVTDRKANRKKGILGNVDRLLLFLIPALVYLPAFWGGAAFPPGGTGYTDLLITHYPYLLYLRDSIITNHQLPMWSTLIHSGAPFAANPLSGLFYLPGWAAMLFPLPAGLNICLAAHAVFGTWGTYRLLRTGDVGELGSVFGALSFGLTPKLAAHFGAGHVSLLYAISWTPWLIYRRRTDTTGLKTGITAGIIFLADPRWAVYAGILLLAYEIAHRHYSISKVVLFYLKASFIALLISSPLWLPLMEYVSLATRSNLTQGDILAGSLPPDQLIGMIIPGSGGNMEWFLYAGGVILGLFIFQLFDKEIRYQNRFWNIWILASLLMSFGSWGIGVNWVKNIPLVGLLRVPARSTLLMGISFSYIGGVTIDHLLIKRAKLSNKKILLLGIIALGTLMAGGVALITQLKQPMILWGFVSFAICGCMLLLLKKYRSNKLFQWVFIGLMVVDMLGAGLTAYTLKGNDSREADVMEIIQVEQDDLFRIYSPSYSVPQYVAAELGLELADGVDPMQIASYAEYMKNASGVSREGYYVSIPPFANGKPERDNMSAVPDSELLGLLNVKYILSEFELDVDGFLPIDVNGIPKIYRNEMVMPRAWLEDADGGSVISSNWREVKVISKTANTLQIEAEGPGKLVISEIYYPGWQVMVDGEKGKIKAAHEILRSVDLPAGKHLVEFVFHPTRVYVGLASAVLGWAVFAFVQIRKKIEKLPS